MCKSLFQPRVQVVQPVERPSPVAPSATPKPSAGVDAKTPTSRTQDKVQKQAEIERKKVRASRKGLDATVIVKPGQQEVASDRIRSVVLTGGA